MWACQTQGNSNSCKYEENFVTYVKFIYEGKPNTPSNYNLHNHVKYRHGTSILQICLLVILAAYGVYANPVLFGDFGKGTNLVGFVEAETQAIGK
jgi:hypothetical protein